MAGPWFDDFCGIFSGGKYGVDRGVKTGRVGRRLGVTKGGGFRASSVRDKNIQVFCGGGFHLGLLVVFTDQAASV